MAAYGIDTRARRRSPQTSPANRTISPNFACRVDVKVAGVWREHGPQTWKRDVQVLHRSAAGCQGPRRGRALPEASRERGSAVRGREARGPGARPDQPFLPIRPGLPERATHDCVRHGTTTLYAPPARLQDGMGYAPHVASPPARRGDAVARRTHHDQLICPGCCKIRINSLIRVCQCTSTYCTSIALLP